MTALTLLINGQAADYFDRDDFPLVIRRLAIDYREPDKRRGDATFTLKLPATAPNRRIFGPLHAPAETDKFARTAPYVAEVYAGGQRLLKGRFILRAVSEAEIEGHIVTGVADLAADLKGVSLRGLNLGAQAFDGWKSMLENIGRQVQNLGDEVPYGLPYTHTEDVIAFPLVCYGNPFLPNKWTAGQVMDVTDWSALYGATINLPVPKEIFGRDTYYLEAASAFHLSFQDVPPCVYVVKVLEALFAAAGWALRGAWLNSDRARRLVMPYVGERPYIYNWELLGTGIYDSPAENAIIIRAWQSQSAPDGDGAKAKIGMFTERFGSPPLRTYAQLYYRTSIPLGGSVDIPAFGGGQILDNWRTYIRILPLPVQAADYGFMRQTRRLATHPGDNVNNPFDSYRSDMYVAPVDGVYTFAATMDITNIAVNLLDDSNNVIPITGWNTTIPGLRYAAGVSVVRGGGDIPAAIDGEFTIRQDLTGPGAEHVLAAQVVTAVGVVNGLTGTVRLNRGDALVVWVGMTSPYAPDKGDVIVSPFSSPFTIHTGPYDPFGYDPGDPGNDPHTFTALIAYGDVSFSVQCGNLPETPEADRFGDLLRPGQNLPDMPGLDFLKTLISLFNLWLDVDADARTATLQSAADFFLPPASALDLTQAVRRLEIRPPALPRYQDFTWRKDGADYLTAERGADYDIRLDTGLGAADGRAAVDSGVFAATEFVDYAIAAAAFDVPVFVDIAFADSPYTVDDDIGFLRLNVDAQGGAITINLPPNPEDAIRVSVQDTYARAGINNITINGNGKDIDGSGADVITEAGAVVQYTFNAATDEWNASPDDGLNASWATPAFAVINTLRAPALADKDSLLRPQNETAAPAYGAEPRLLQVWRTVLVNPADFTRGLPIRVFDVALPLGQRDYYDRLTHHIELSFDGQGDGAGDPYPTLAWRGAAGLYATLYRALYDAITRGEEVEGEFRLTPQDVEALQINRPISINGVRYWLKELKGYNPITQAPTTLILTRR